MGLKLGPQTLRRLRKFRRIRRGWLSLLVLSVVYVMSLGSELFIGNRPLVMRYDGDWSFPAFSKTYYSAKRFGSRIDIEMTFAS